MIRTQIYLPEDLKQELEILSKQEKKPVAEIVRRAVKKEVNRRQKNTGDIFAKIASYAGEGPRDLSSNLFAYLYGEKSDYANKKRSKKR